MYSKAMASVKNNYNGGSRLLSNPVYSLLTVTTNFRKLNNEPDEADAAK